MGSTTSLETDGSREFRLAHGKTSTSDVERVLQKPLNDLSNVELLVLCRHYKFYEKKVITALENTSEFNGADYCDLVEMTKADEIAKEKDRLIDVVDRYVKDRGQSKFFIYKVVFRKFKDERSFIWKKDEASDSNNEPSETEISTVPITTTTKPNVFATLSKDPFTIVESSGSDSVKEYTIETPFERYKLNEFEQKGVDKVKKKIRDYLKKHNTTPEQQHYSSDLEIEAQNYVCEDRFMSHFFIRPIRKVKNTRIVNVPATLRVKLLVSELNNSPLVNKSMATFSKLLDINEYGIVHTGILIGEWKIEWFDNSLVSVKCDSDGDLKTSKTIAAIDIGEICGVGKVREAFNLITKISCKYNANKDYSVLKANCQHFVSELMDALQLTLPNSKAFNIYFEKLKKGDTDRTYYINETLKKMIQSSTIQNPYRGKNEITFENRKELDEFSHFLDELKYFELEEGTHDFWLLKAFDRSFVLIDNSETCTYYDPNTGNVKDKAFFTVNGDRFENSITNIKYSVKDVDFSDITMRR